MTNSFNTLATKDISKSKDQTIEELGEEMDVIFREVEFWWKRANDIAAQIDELESLSFLPDTEAKQEALIQEYATIAARMKRENERLSDFAARYNKEAAKHGLVLIKERK